MFVSIILVISLSLFVCFAVQWNQELEHDNSCFLGVFHGTARRNWRFLEDLAPLRHICWARSCFKVWNGLVTAKCAHCAPA